MTKQLCKNCKHLETDGMFGIFCGVGGNNRNHDCSKYEEKTEKRFTYDSKTVSILKDGEFWLDGNIDTACNHSEICNELNNLADENEQLKNEIEKITYANEDLLTEKRIWKQMSDEYTKLSDENEQLKQAYTQLKHRHSLLHDVCIDAECDRDSYQKDVSSLEKENEDLKKLLEAYRKSVEDYKYQIRKGVKENLTMLELADNCGVDVK